MPVKAISLSFSTSPKTLSLRFDPVLVFRKMSFGITTVPITVSVNLLQSHPVRTCTYVLQHAGAGLLWGLSEVDSHTRCSVSIAGSLVPSACGPLLGAVLGITNPAAALPLVRGAEVLGAAFPGATCLV